MLLTARAAGGAQSGRVDSREQSSIRWTNESPLPLTAGSRDHIIPAHLNKTSADKYRDAGSVTDSREFDGRDPLTIVEDGWETVADFIEEWLETPGV